MSARPIGNKANVREKVHFSRTDFLPWEILLIKKLDFEKTKFPGFQIFIHSKFNGLIETFFKGSIEEAVFC